MEFEQSSADFVFELNDEVIEISLPLMKKSEYQKAEKVLRNQKATYAISYENYEKDYSWFRMIDNSTTAYLRIMQFAEGKGQNLFSAVEKMKKTIDELGYVDKTVIDIRNNSGGNGSTSIQRLIDVLNTREVGNVYVLIDDSSVSMSAAAAIRIKNEVENVFVIGIPAGTGSSTFSVSGNGKKMLHSKNYYQIGGIYSYLDVNQKYDAFMPDVLVYPTIDDYVDGIDTILQYALNQ